MTYMHDIFMAEEEGWPGMVVDHVIIPGTKRVRSLLVAASFILTVKPLAQITKKTPVSSRSPGLCDEAVLNIVHKKRKKSKNPPIFIL